HGDVYAAWDGEPSGYSTMPDRTPEIASGTRYLHVTSNETIGGIRMVDFPRPDVPLVGDMSSDYLSRPIEWDLFDLVYGGVQKNLAPAGMAVVYIRKQALNNARIDLGSYLRYDWHAKSNSLGNTPPMFPIYLMGKVLRRMQAAGGLHTMEKQAAEKAGRLYQTIDRSEGFYRNPVTERFRSHMNVVFRLPDPSLEGLFLKEAESRHMIGLKGHRSVGGCRASLYAALPMDSVEALSDLMEEFARSHRAL
ncbi:MAG TPA: 3-phosphoserine/phosphohydroxythreonine transaminase, partial [Acidimicrobiia bacterium]